MKNDLIITILTKLSQNANDNQNKQNITILLANFQILLNHIAITKISLHTKSL